MSSLRDAILHADDIDREDLEVPQWGVTVQVRGMSGLERAAFVQNFADNEGKLDYSSLYPDLVIAGVHDPADGSRVFTDEDRSWIMTKSGAALEKVATSVMRLSGLGPKAEEEAGKP